MYIVFNGTCKNCGRKIMIEFNTSLNGGDFYSSKCPYCDFEYPAPTMERLNRIADSLIAHARVTEPFKIDSIDVTRSKEDVEYLIARRTKLGIPK